MNEVRAMGQIDLEMGDNVERRIEGVIGKVIYRGRGRGIVALDLAGGDRVKVIGPMPDSAVEGTRVSALGKDELDPKFGPQFVAGLIEVVMPTSSAGVEEYLASGIVFGIGDGLARRIVARLGADALDRIAEDPECLDDIPGITAEKARDLARVIRAQRVEARTLSFLLGLGLGAGRARRTFLAWKEHTIDRVRRNPYDLALEISGIGFNTADEIARNMGIPADSPFRAQGALIHWLESAASSGHVFMTSSVLLEELASKLGFDFGVLVDALIDLEAAKRVVIEARDDENGTVELVYLSRLHRDEVVVARSLASIMDGEDPSPIKESMTETLEQTIAHVERELGIVLASAQREAVAGAIEGKLMVVTGGPGSGKCLGRGTPVMRYDGRIVAVEDVRRGDALMGSDGKARRVLSTATGRGPLFRITPKKGDSWVCNAGHVLTLVRSGTARAGEVMDIALDDFLACSPGSKTRTRSKLFRVPVRKFGSSGRGLPTISAYIAGVWLGDGSRHSKSITTPDLEIITAIRDEARRCGLLTTELQEPSGCWSMRIVRTKGGIGGRRPRNPALVDFRSLVDRDGKFIPHALKTAAWDTRRQLLAGLVDTDGYRDKCGVDIITKWRRLADDMAFVARSLGILATISPKPVKLKGWEESRLYWRVILSGEELSALPCRIARKRPARRRQIKNVLRTGFSVEPLGDGDYFGFELDGDGRFLLGDFTVTHNTTLIRAIVRTLEFARRSFALAAPTGKAARRMEKATSQDASTIHRLLEYDPETGGFKRSASNPLPMDWIIIDEASMVDVTLMRSLVNAIPNSSHLVLVGDVDQLPSVGPGTVLSSVIRSGAVPVVRLTEIFRQAATSGIVMNAHRVNRGQPPWEAGVEWPDFEIVEEADAAEARRVIVDLVANRLPDRFGFDPFSDIQVLAPMRKPGYALGVVRLNEALRDALNPRGEDIPGPREEEKDPVTGVKRAKFRDGDRVMQTVNDYELGVMNGETGVIDGFDPNGKVVVKFDDREAAYSKDALDNLDLAYACSIHKSQGSEIPCVVIALHDQHHIMLRRNLLYTAITRGKKHVVIVGTKKAMRIAASQEDTRRRNTSLSARIREGMSG